MKSYKLNMTRPEFLKKFLTDSDDISDITMADMETNHSWMFQFDLRLLLLHYGM